MATNTAVADLNRVQYIGLDFPTHFDDLRSELQSKFAADFNDFALSSLAIMLTDLTAYGLDTLSFYLDRRASDSYLATAQTRKAVARLTRQLGYKMGGAVSSSTDLSVRVTNPVNFLVTIPKSFQFKGPNNLIFEASEAVTISALSAATVTVPVYEGETITETFVGDGSPNQVFQLAAVPTNKNVVQGSVTVLVDGTTYTEAEFLPITGGQYFEVGYNDDPATISFGDGTVSQNDIPTSGATVSVSYIASRGLAGQVSANTITAVVTPLIINYVTVGLTLTNPEAAVGGDDPESLDRAKALAPQVYKSRQVAITQEDYVSLSTAFADPLFGRVAVAQAISSRSGESDLELQTLLQDVRDTIAPIKDAVDADVAALQAQTAIETTALADMTVQTGIISTQAAAILTAIGGTASARSTLQNAIGTLSLDISRCNDGTTKVNLIPTATGITLKTTVDFNQPLAVGDEITVLVDSIAGLAIGQSIRLSNISGNYVGSYTVKLVPTVTSVTLLLADNTDGTGFGSPVYAGAVGVSVPSDALTNETRTQLSQLFSAISSDQQTVSGNITTALNYIGTALTARDAIVVANAVLNTDIGTVSAAVNNINTVIVPALLADVVPLATTGVATDTVNADLAAISDHVGAILSANCSANLITVPILTKDADGFYAAPSVGLKNSLQTYLNARKGVTQTVTVTSGARAIIKANISIQVGVKQGFSENVVKAAVTSAVDGLLKGREFGVSLYVSDIVETVRAVAGVSYLNPIITGYLDPVTPSVVLTDKIDAYGNLIIDQSEVVSKASVSITTVLRSNP